MFSFISKVKNTTKNSFRSFSTNLNSNGDSSVFKKLFKRARLFTAFGVFAGAIWIGDLYINDDLDDVLDDKFRNRLSLEEQKSRYESFLQNKLTYF